MNPSTSKPVKVRCFSAMHPMGWRRRSPPRPALARLGTHWAGQSHLEIEVAEREAEAAIESLRLKAVLTFRIL